MTARRGPPTSQRPGWLRRALTRGVAVGAVGACLLGATGTAGAADPVRISGVGSTLASIALGRWTSDLTAAGMEVSYNPTGSPEGLARFPTTADFALSELEYPSVAPDLEPTLGYQYLPALANALAVSFNVEDDAARPLDSLHLPPRVIARIFLGDIEQWSDPAIAAANPGVSLPDEPINVVYPNGSSGTTAFFFDFVEATAPDLFVPWAIAHGFSTEHRIADVGTDPTFAPRSTGLDGSDAIAQHLASEAGRWSIGYVPFAFAATYRADVASTANAAGSTVQPSAAGATAALRGATWHGDTGIDLGGAYTSSDPTAYPISFVSYLLTPCQPMVGVPTCDGGGGDPAHAAALAAFVRFAACDGQADLAAIGLAPLPENLSQAAVDGIPRLIGSHGAPEVLTAATCANPAFVDPPPTTTTTTSQPPADGAAPSTPVSPTAPASPVVVAPALAG